MAVDIETACRLLITAGVNSWVKNGGTIKELAEDAGVSPQTLKNLAYGKTQYPRFHTVVTVLGSLCYTFGIEKSPVRGKKGTKNVGRTTTRKAKNPPAQPVQQPTH